MDLTKGRQRTEDKTGTSVAIATICNDVLWNLSVFLQLVRGMLGEGRRVVHG